MRTRRDRVPLSQSFGLLGEDPVYSPNPNLFLGAFIEQYGNPESPIAGRVPTEIRAGKNTYVYDTHTYHTKVPPAGIAAFIGAFTKPGDLVLDPFCGSGMTGVAARSTGRHVILSDLSPAATFIAYNLLRDMPVDEWDSVCEAFMRRYSRLERLLYHTPCRRCGNAHRLLYAVWSYRVECPLCGGEFNYWDVGRSIGETVRTSRLRTEVECPYCKRVQPKRALARTRLEPVQVGYRCPASRGMQESMAVPTEYDLRLLDRIDKHGVPSWLWYPTARLPVGYNTRQPVPHGISSVDAFYTTRNLWAMAALWSGATQWPDPVQRQRLLFALTGLYLRVTKFSEFRFWGGSSNSARLYVPMVMNEQNVFDTLRRKLRHIRDHLGSAGYDTSSRFCITTQSSTDLSQIPDRSIDYIFTDPPFGANINYSEMNFLWESWLGTYTDNREEVIVNSFQDKGLTQYEELLARVFSECRRVLKPGGSMTVVFNNSSQRVWRCIARSLERSGFHIKASLTFDKRHPTLKQLTAPNVAGLDVALHCESGEVDSRFAEATLEQLRGVIRRHLDSRDRARPAESTPRALYGAANAELLSRGLLPPLNFEAFRDWAGREFSGELESEPMPRYLRELARRGIQRGLPTSQLAFSLFGDTNEGQRGL